MYSVVVVEVAGIKCRALLIVKITESANLSNQATTGFNKVDFKMKAYVTKVEKPHLIIVDNPQYKKLIEKHPHLKSVTMDDTDERSRLPVHIIQGSSECPRISATEPQRVGRE